MKLKLLGIRANFKPKKYKNHCRMEDKNILYVP